MTRAMKFGAVASILCLMLACGGRNQSNVEGSVVDWNGDPIRGISVHAYQQDPIAGYDFLETRTRRDGSFQIRGLYPGGTYVILPHSDKWQLEEPVTDMFGSINLPPSVVLITAPAERETRIIPSPLAIDAVYSIEHPILYADMASGRLARSSVEGIIADAEGTPVSNVVVIAELVTPDSLSQLGFASSRLQARRVEYIAKADIDTPSVETTTRRDGRFVLDNLIAGVSYSVRFRSDLWESRQQVELTPPSHHGEVKQLSDPISLTNVMSKKAPSMPANVHTGEIAEVAFAGTLLDGNSTPIPGIRILAIPERFGRNRISSDDVEELMEQESTRFTSMTDSSGTFRFEQLWAGTRYRIQPESDMWRTSAHTMFDAPSHAGGTNTMQRPMVLQDVMSMEIPTLPANVHTGEIAEIVFEGTLVDVDSTPIPGIQMLAIPERFGRNQLSSEYVEELIEKEADRFTTVTDSTGGFRFDQLWAGTRYRVQPDSEIWQTGAHATFDAPGRAGETLSMSSPMVLQAAFHKESGFRIEDFRTGTARFEISEEGVISDSNTGLEWLVGPDSSMNHAAALEWAEQCDVAGGGWRLPTQEELGALLDGAYQRSNRAPAFKHDRVWTNDRTGQSSFAVIVFSRARSESTRTSNRNHVYVVR